MDSQKAERELIALSNKWMEAVQRRDFKTLNELLDDDFTLTSSMTNVPWDKKEWIDAANSRYVIKSFEYKSSSIQVYNDDAAVVRSAYHQEAAVDGQDNSGDFLITDFWVRKTDGKWHVVARHTSGPVKRSGSERAGN
jgi:ketosteroid isomerase-like protein